MESVTTDIADLRKIEKETSLIGGLVSFVLESIEAIIVALAVCTVLYLFLITPHEVVGKSMDPSFKNGEYLIANKLAYRIGEPQRGDVIIFRHSATQDYIKRIIGLSGDEISLKDGRFYVNGILLDETAYLDPAVYTNGGAVLKEGETFVVPEGEYFVAGDNRPHSSDSRTFGSIEKTDIKGKAWIVYFPFNQFRLIEHQTYIQDK